MYPKSQPPDAPTPDGHRSTARRTYNSLSHGILYHLRGSHTIQNVCAGCYFYTMKEGDNHAKTQEISKIAEWLLRYGQIRYLGKGRRNPYGVYPPAVEEYDNGHKKRLLPYAMFLTEWWGWQYSHPTKPGHISQGMKS